MVAPSGFCGVHSLPKAAQSLGFFSPRRIRPLMQRWDSFGLDRVDLEDPLGVVLAVLVSQLVTGLGNRSHAAPLAVADPNTSKIRFARGRLPSRLTVRAYWFVTSTRPASSCWMAMKMPSSRSSGSKAGDHDGDAVALG